MCKKPQDGILYDQDELTGDYLVVGEGIDALATTADGEIVALDGEGEDLFTFDVETRAWKEVKVDPNYGCIVGGGNSGEEILPIIKDWWEGYKENMPTNEDIKWMIYEDGSKVELGEILGETYTYSANKTYGLILAGIVDLPDSVDANDYEKVLLTLSPTNPDKIEEAGNITPIRLSTRPDYSSFTTVSLKITGEGGAIKDNRYWNYVDVAYNIPHKDLIRFLQAGLSGDNPPLKGCQLAVSLTGANTADYDTDEYKQLTAISSEVGDGEWEAENSFSNYALVPQGAGLFAIPESCMTEEMWGVFGTLPNNPVGGNQSPF